MPIICFEGASAVGKTTVSKHLHENFDAYVIPEVNLLFQRTRNESKYWYFERQTERWEMAVSAAEKYRLVILDGDPFQPLWYNWSYNYDFGNSFDEIMHFYQSALTDKRINFPDKYFILSINTDELKKRQLNDSSRTRKNFERHLRFINPQRAYFNFIKSIDDNLVEFIENSEVESTSEKITNSIDNNSVSNKKSWLELFVKIKTWLINNNAGHNFG